MSAIKTSQNDDEMPFVNHQANAYKLLGIIQSHANNGTQQTIPASIYNRALKSGMDYPELTALMSAMLADGLTYGEWPWVLWNREVPKSAPTGTWQSILIEARKEFKALRFNLTGGASK